MEQKVIFDWKSCVALGVTIIGIILVTRMPDDAVGSAFDQLIDAAKSLTIAATSSH